MASLSEEFVPSRTDGMSVRGHVRGSDGGPIADAALTLIDSGGRQLGRDTSDRDGAYLLSVPGPGTYVLIVSAGAHQPEASTVTVGGTPAVVDVVLSGTSSLAGIVRMAGGGAPVNGATVTLVDGRGEVFTARTTGTDGRYLFDDLVAGTYTLVVRVEACQPVAVAVSVPDTGQRQQDVEVSGGSRLHGVARSVDGRPVPDARVTLLDHAGDVVGVATTDDAGEYGFADLPEGDYTVIASGYPPVAATLRVTGGEYGRHDPRLGHPDA